jgi:hypothetical protein
VSASFSSFSRCFVKCVIGFPENALKFIR